MSNTCQRRIQNSVEHLPGGAFVNKDNCYQPLTISTKIPIVVVRLGSKCASVSDAGD